MGDIDPTLPLVRAQLTPTGTDMADARPTQSPSAPGSAPAVATSASDAAVARAFNIHKHPGARIGRSTNQTIADSVLTLVTFTYATYDDEGMIALPSTKLFFRSAGYWGITCKTTWIPNAAGNRELSILYNGFGLIGGDFRTPGAAGVGELQTTFEFGFAVDDFLEVEVLQSSGGPLDLLALGNAPILTARLLKEL